MDTLPKNITDLRGQRFGRLTVLSYEGCSARNRWKRRHYQWRVACDCGNELVKTGHLLRAGVRSCGCLRRQRKTGIEALTRRLKERELRWDLDEEVFIDLVDRPCAFCGTGGRSEPILKIEELGYVPGNCAPSCQICLRAKAKMNMFEYWDWIKAVAERVG